MNDMNTGTKGPENYELEVLTFTCPHCGSHLIEEIVMMERNIEWIAVPGDPDYDWNEDQDRNVSIGPTYPTSETDRNHYRCRECGAPLLDNEGNVFWGFQLLLEWLRQKRDAEAVEQPRGNMFRFTCPDCRGHHLYEIFRGATPIYGVKGVFGDGEIVYGRFRQFENDEDRQFQCGDCGYELNDDHDPVSDDEALVKWLLGHCNDDADETRQG